MKHKIFTVYDSKVQAYMLPFYQQTKGAAIRAFKDTCNDSTHPFYKHPEDYTLFELGEFDDGKAKFELYKTPISLGVAHEYKETMYSPEGEDNAVRNVTSIQSSSRS